MDTTILLDSSQLIRVDSTLSVHYRVVPGKPVRLGIIVDQPLHSASLSFSVEAVSPHSMCEIRILSILDTAHIDVKAQLIVRQGAVSTQFHLHHQTVLLSEKAHIQTQPELVIEQDEVKCGHGATVSTLDSLTLLFLESRGITRQDAKTMLCSSYIQSVCDWVLMKSDAVPLLDQ